MANTPKFRERVVIETQKTCGSGAKSCSSLAKVSPIRISPKEVAKYLIARGDLLRDGIIWTHKTI